MAAELPSGVVTFLFTDIEGSTRLFQRFGGAYRDLLADHHRILRAAFAQWRGVEVKTEGDAFFVAFESASDAVAACLAAQRGLASHGWPSDGVVRVRIGISSRLRSGWPARSARPHATRSIDPPGLERRPRAVGRGAGTPVAARETPRR